MILPPFIPLAGDPIAGLPYLHFDATLHAILVRGSRSAQQALVDRTLNKIPGGRFEAISSLVLLTALYVERVTSGHPDYAERGSISESDIGFWTLTFGGPSGRQRRPRWFPSYLFVDGAAALFAGREVFGYPKFLGSPDRGPDLKNDLAVKVRTQFFEKFGASARPVFDVLFETSGRSLPGAKNERLPDMAALEERFADHLLDKRTGRLASRLSLPYGRMPMVFVKQFRNIAQPDLASYQAVTETVVKTTRLRSVELKSPPKLKLVESASHPIGRDLGINPETKAILAACVRHDFKVGAGSELVRAS